VSFKSQLVLHTSPLNTHHNIKMLSSISSYIWGPSEEPIGKLADEMDDDERSSLNSSPPLMLPPAATPEDLNSPTATTEDWVLVGQQPQPGNLATGGIGPLPPVTPSSVSSASSIIGEDDLPRQVGEESHSQAGSHRLPAQSSSQAVQVSASASLKSLKAAQVCRQRSSGKALSSKSLKRSNKAVISCGGGKRRENSSKYNMSIKSAGYNKNLKQC